MRKKENGARNIYMNYSDEVQTTMWNVHKYLIKKYGVIQSEWVSTLAMLADNYSIFFLCRDAIKKDGLMIVDRFNVLVKHPLIKVQIDAQIQVVKLLNEFGLSPKSAAKLNDTNEDEEDSLLNEFIEKR